MIEKEEEEEGEEGREEGLEEKWRCVCRCSEGRTKLS